MEVTPNLSDLEWVNVMGTNIQTKYIKRGEGETAEMGTVVSCNLTGYFDDDVDHKKPFETLHNQVFVIGEMDTLPSIELSLRHSTVGDIYWLRSSFKFAFGLLGRRGVARDLVIDPVATPSQPSPIVAIPPNMDLEYYVEVLGHYENAAAAATAVAGAGADIPTASSSGFSLAEGNKVETSMIHSPILDSLADTELRRVCGNRWFSYGDFPKAKKSYARGVELAQAYLSHEQGPENENENDNEGQVTELADDDNIDKETLDQDIPDVDSVNRGLLMVSLISCLGNLAACHLSMKEYAKTKEICVRVLELEPDNIKALIRAAKASLALHEYDECALCLESVKQIDPGNPSLAAELSRLKTARSAYEAKEKQMAKNMASKLFK